MSNCLKRLNSYQVDDQQVPGSSTINFINILRARFSYESLFGTFFLVTFWQKKALSYEKPARKMLMKLTPGLRMTDNNPTDAQVSDHAGHH